MMSGYLSAVSGCMREEALVARKTLVKLPFRHAPTSSIITESAVDNAAPWQLPQNQSFGATVVHEWQEIETTVIPETQVDDIEETGVVANDIPSSVAFANPALASASAA